MNKPQPQVLIIWRILLTLSYIVPSFIVSLLFRGDTLPRILLMVFISLSYITLYAVYLPLLLKNVSFGVFGEKLVLFTGVMTSRVIAVPISEIRYVTVIQTFFDRFFGLASVVVTAPGSRMTLTGLKYDDANKLASILLPEKGKGGE